MQRYMRRWPWWSPVRLLPALMMLDLLTLGVIAAYDAVARGLQVCLVALATGTIAVVVVGAVARQRWRLGPLLFGAGFLLSMWGLVGLFVPGLIWQGSVALILMVAVGFAPVLVRAIWPMRTTTDDEAWA